MRISGTITPHNATVLLVQHDPGWSMQHLAEERKHYANAKGEVIEEIIARALADGY